MFHAGIGVARGALPSTRYYLDILSLINKQKGLLEAAIMAVKPGGVIIYSTCSFLPHENELVLNGFLKDRISLEPVGIPGLNVPGITLWNDQELHPDLKFALRIYPQDFDSVGFFVAKIRVKENKEGESEAHENSSAWKERYHKPASWRFYSD